MLKFAKAILLFISQERFKNIECDVTYGRILNEFKIMIKFACSIAQEVCDDFKRVMFQAAKTNQTFYVDCQGYDIDGSLIFDELQNNELLDYYNNQYDIINNRRVGNSYENSQFDYDSAINKRSIAVGVWNYPDNQDPILLASHLDFLHCSQYRQCQSFKYKNLQVCFENIETAAWL